MYIPLNKPYLDGREIKAAATVIKSGKIAGNGSIGQKVEKSMEKIFKVNYAFLTTSCTHALEAALMALDIKEGDEVILPSFAFVSAANAIVLREARPVFCDIEDKSFNIDPDKIEQLITPRTKAIIVIHYAGWPCQMGKILKIGQKYNIKIIEDAAQAVGSKYKDKFLGTIGDIGCYSLHETKNFTCGEGGAFLTNSKTIARNMEIIREKGTNRSAFIRGEINKYTWVKKGSSYVLSDILAAIVGIQLRKLKEIISKREKIGLRYLDCLEEIEKRGKIILPSFDAGNQFNWHIFYFRVSGKRERNFLIARLRERGIGVTFHFIPLHLSPYAKRKLGYKKGDFPVTERVSNALLRLPIYPSLTIKEQEYIIKNIWKLLK